MSDLSPACGYEGEHYHAPGVDPNCLSCTHPPELDELEDDERTHIGPWT